jgi:hypothetical protein
MKIQVFAEVNEGAKAAAKIVASEARAVIHQTTSTT